MTPTEIAIQLLILLLSVGGLWIGARALVEKVVKLARRIGLSELTIGLTVVAAGTSTPELVVTTDAALKGLGDVAVGNIVGSNVYNLAFILGVVSVVRVIPIERSLVHRDGLALVGSTLVGAAVLLDLRIGRLEGALLAGLFVAYTAFLLLQSRGSDPTAADDDTHAVNAGDESAAPSPRETADEADHDATGGGGETTAGTTGAVGVNTSESTSTQEPIRLRDVVLLIGGLAVVLVSGDVLVGAATTLARGAGLSESVIGGTIVAAGTSTPEFAVSLVAIQRDRLGVSIGNVVGSNVFNVLGILGLASLVRPLSFSVGILDTVAWLVVITIVVVALLWTGRKLTRPEGTLLAGSEIGRWVLGLGGLLG